MSTEKARLLYAGVHVGGGYAWGEPEIAPKSTKTATPVDWSEFETWFESEGKKPAKEELDAALEKKFGPYPDS